MPSVIYTYGSPGAGNNRAGRIATVENGNMKGLFTPLPMDKKQ